LLKEIPSSISGLKNLRELNVANNLLNYLPSEILGLSLDSLSVHPNPFYPCPREAEKDSKLFEDLIIHHAGSAPLSELLIRRLIRPLAFGEERSVLTHMYALPLPSCEVLGVSEDIYAKVKPPMDFRNPSHTVCPSPRHKGEPTPLFVDPVTERYEWIDRIGGMFISAPRVPIRWRGCSLNCLNFLDGQETEQQQFQSGLGPNDESFEFSSDEESGGEE
jgi:hypothetical protein